LYAAAANPRLPNWARSSRRNSADFGSAWTGSKGIVKKPLCGRHRHKLGDTLTPLTRARYRPHSIGPKAALLPNDSSKEFERQAVCGHPIIW